MTTRRTLGLSHNSKPENIGQINWAFQNFTRLLMQENSLDITPLFKITPK